LLRCLQEVPQLILADPLMWKTTFFEDLEAIELTWRGAKRVTSDHPRCRQLVAQCPNRDGSSQDLRIHLFKIFTLNALLHVSQKVLQFFLTHTEKSSIADVDILVLGKLI